MKVGKAIRKKMWAIYGVHGLYVGTQHTRKDMIEEHTRDLANSWEYCKKKGDRAVKVMVEIIEE